MMLRLLMLLSGWRGVEARLEVGLAGRSKAMRLHCIVVMLRQCMLKRRQVEGADRASVEAFLGLLLLAGSW